MKEKIYYYSKRKLLIRLSIASVIVLVCFKLVYSAISSGEIGRIGLLIFVGIVGLGAALFLLVSIPFLIIKPSKEIEINDKGMYSSGNSGSEIGFIAWDNISQISQNQIENKSYICVHVHDTSPFSNKIKNKKRRTLLGYNNIALLIDNSDVNESLQTIFSEIERYYKKYGTCFSSDEDKNISKSKNKPLPDFDLRIPILNSLVFMHYDSGVNQNKDLDNPNWMNQYVFFWSSTEKFEKKSLLPEFKDYQSKYFVIMKQSNLIKLSKMKVMPWFGMPGDGEKYFFSSNNTYLPLDRLFKAGHLKYIKLLNKKHHIFYDLNNIYAVLDDKYKVEFPDKEIALNQAILNDSINLFQIAK